MLESEMFNKVYRVVSGCKTPAQLQAARKYFDLAKAREDFDYKQLGALCFFYQKQKEAVEC
jgi:hypothetical protein